MKKPIESGLIKLSDAAKLLGITRTQVVNLINDNKLDEDNTLIRAVVKNQKWEEVKKFYRHKKKFRAS